MPTATALNIMFSKLSGLALANYQSTHFDSLMRLALRAQSQSGRTLETLARLRNPAVFAQQVNVAHQQIVANGAAQCLGHPAQDHSPTSAAPAQVPSSDTPVLPAESPNSVRLAKKILPLPIPLVPASTPSLLPSLPR